MFINREKELASLRKLKNSGKFEMAVVYGRRRVGKTTLLKEFSKEMESIFFVCDEVNEKM
ncbi:MAG: ATP-binding protein, partial [Mesotoga sp.]